MEITHGRDKNAAAIKEDAIGILPIGKAGVKDGRDILINKLQGLKDEGLPLGCLKDFTREGEVNGLDEDKGGGVG